MHVWLEPGHLIARFAWYALFPWSIYFAVHVFYLILRVNCTVGMENIEMNYLQNEHVEVSAYNLSSIGCFIEGSTTWHHHSWTQRKCSKLNLIDDSLCEIRFQRWCLETPCLKYTCMFLIISYVLGQLISYFLLTKTAMHNYKYLSGLMLIFHGNSTRNLI